MKGFDFGSRHRKFLRKIIISSSFPSSSRLSTSSPNKGRPLAEGTGASRMRNGEMEPHYKVVFSSREPNDLQENPISRYKDTPETPTV